MQDILCNMKTEETYTGYLIVFNVVDTNGIIYKKDSIDTKIFDQLKEKNEIIDYKVDDKGVLITKKI
jgi:hypothetical protein